MNIENLQRRRGNMGLRAKNFRRMHITAFLLLPWTGKGNQCLCIDTVQTGNVPSTITPFLGSRMPSYPATLSDHLRKKSDAVLCKPEVVRFAFNEGYYELLSPVRVWRLFGVSTQGLWGRLTRIIPAWKRQDDAEKWYPIIGYTPCLLLFDIRDS